ncbi:hypothetical protein Q4555_03575 [Octadecabacter sp. 1_MG-2023]|uniref:hypothetical protein n=1 Tax=unclassified Octadecabacter TaxID=196158 RepID=UPI001C0A3FC2|nr:MULTISPECIES: hypothetical protein [unclassified Octadecabacter]MBU2992816.1 hypothetical protein [Octadecabacter sp. B2R22]MDO6733733.1 hypothetical protein [Octadecabacter sp. 1_MG-2023]
MRNAAAILGIIAGVMGIFVGLFGYGWVTLTNEVPEASQLGMFERPGFVQFASFAAPLACIAGGAMAKARALWGGIALLIGAGLFYAAFGFNVATMFPIGFAGLGGILAIAAGKPDEDVAHF